MEGDGIGKVHVVRHGTSRKKRVASVAKNVLQISRSKEYSRLMLAVSVALERALISMLRRCRGEESGLLGHQAGRKRWGGGGVPTPHSDEGSQDKPRLCTETKRSRR